MSDTAVLFISILAAAIPTALYISLIYWADRYEKEPFWLLSATFLWGAIPSVIIAFIFNSTLGIPVYLLAVDTTFSDTAVAIFIAPIVEESVKGMALVFIFLFWQQEIDSPLDGIIYGAMVGLGFALVENIYYFWNEFQTGGINAWSLNIFLRSFIFGLNHALFSSMTGLGIALGRLSPNLALKIAAPVSGWLAAVFLHFMHNITVLQGGVLVCFTLLFDWGGILLLLVIMLWALLQERNWLKQYLADEIRRGTLTTNQYQTAISGHRRFLFSLNLLFSRGFRANRVSASFFHRCSELAYKKHHQSLFKDKKSAEAIESLRREIIVLGQKLL